MQQSNSVIVHITKKKKKKKKINTKVNTARFTEVAWCFFANNSVSIASATMKLDQNSVPLTP